MRRLTQAEPTSEVRRPASAMVALLVGAMAIAFAPIFAKLAMGPEGVGSTAAAFWRVALASPVFFIVWMRSKAELRWSEATAPAIAWLLAPGVLFAGDMFVWHASFEHTSAASATLLANLQVVIMGFAGWLLYEERLTPSFLFGAVVAFGGVALLVWANQGAVTGGQRTQLGDGLAMLTACFYGAYLLTIRSLGQRYSVLSIMTAASVTCAAVLLPLSLFSEQPFIPTAPGVWAYLAALAFISHCLGQGLIAFALARLPASSSGVTLLVQPVATAVWGWLLLSEQLNLYQVVAGFAVLAGIWLAWRSGRD